MIICCITAPPVWLGRNECARSSAVASAHCPSQYWEATATARVSVAISSTPTSTSALGWPHRHALRPILRSARVWCCNLRLQRYLDEGTRPELLLMIRHGISKREFKTRA